MSEATNPHINHYLGKPPTELVDCLVDIELQYRQASAVVKELEDLYNAVEAALVAAHVADPQLLKVGTTNGTVSFSEETVYNIPAEQWDSLYEYIAQNNAFYLLQRRVNQAPIKELLTQGHELPFVSPFKRTKVGLSMPRKRAQA